MRACWGYGLHKLLETIVEWFWESQPEGESPYTKSEWDGRIQSTTRHVDLVGSQGTTPRLNTP